MSKSIQNIKLAFVLLENPKIVNHMSAVNFFKKLGFTEVTYDYETKYQNDKYITVVCTNEGHIICKEKNDLDSSYQKLHSNSPQCSAVYIVGTEANGSTFIPINCINDII